MDQNLISFIKSSLSCTICLDFFKYPHTIKCGHTFCGGCLQRWMDQTVECPMCRSEIPQEPVPNLVLMDQIEKFTNKCNDIAIHKMDYGWKKYVKPLVIKDEEDGVERCLVCHWEIFGDECNCNNIMDHVDTPDESEIQDVWNDIDIQEAWDDVYDEPLGGPCPFMCDCDDCDCSDNESLEYYGEEPY